MTYSGIQFYKSPIQNYKEISRIKVESVTAPVAARLFLSLSHNFYINPSLMDSICIVTQKPCFINSLLDRPSYK